MAAARKSGDATLLARAALTAFGELRPGVVDPEAVSALEEARAALGAGDAKLACRVEARLTAALQPARDPYAVVRRARDVIAQARATGDEALVAEVLVTAGAALVDYSPVEERRELARELRDYAERRGDGEKLLRARARLAMDALEMGDFADYSNEVDAMLDLSLELGHARYRWLPLLFASMRACMHGRFAESERYLVEVDQLAVLTDDPALPTSLAAHRALRAKDTDDPESIARVSAGIARALQGVPEALTIAAVLRAGLFTRARDRARTEAELAKVELALPYVLGDGTFSFLVVEAAAFAGSEALRRALRERIESFSSREVPGGHVPVTYEGPAVRMLALLDAVLGDEERAEHRFREALARAKLHGLKPWIARIDFELGSLLESRGQREEARALLAESAALAVELGIPSLVRDGGLRVEPPVTTVTELGLARDGDVWRVQGSGREVRVRDMRGMRLLARLIEHRGQEIHVLVLASEEGVPVDESDAGPRIDERALRAYRARLAELAEELDEAERNADRGRAERLRAEQAALEDEIRGAVGLGGKARKAGSATERARVNVQRRLKDALSRIADADAGLGQRFGAAVRTGTYCSFQP
jgi:tetratricopeptide (TPR) repeat protein